MKTKEELNELKEKEVTLPHTPGELTEDELDKAAGGSLVIGPVPSSDYAFTK